MSENSGDYASVSSPEGATASPEPAECGKYEVDAPVVPMVPASRGRYHTARSDVSGKRGLWTLISPSG